MSWVLLPHPPSQSWSSSSAAAGIVCRDKVLEDVCREKGKGQSVCVSSCHLWKHISDSWLELALLIKNASCAFKTNGFCLKVGYVEVMFKLKSPGVIINKISLFCRLSRCMCLHTVNVHVSAILWEICNVQWMYNSVCDDGRGDREAHNCQTEYIYIDPTTFQLATHSLLCFTFYISSSFLCPKLTNTAQTQSLHKAPYTHRSRHP